MATTINGKARHMSDIMFCHQFSKFRRTIRPTDAVWADFIGNENGTSTSVELSWVLGDTGNVSHQGLLE